MSFFNEGRGLHIRGTDFRYYSEGAFGLIFVDVDRGRARKIYRVKADTDHAHSAALFESEVSAYEFAMASEPARNLVPQFFGRCRQVSILDRDGNDVSGDVYGELAFEMAFISGEFQKLSEFQESERARVTEILRKVGIFYVIDASAVGCDGVISKVVDFSTKEIEVCAAEDFNEQLASP